MYSSCSWEPFSSNLSDSIPASSSMMPSAEDEDASPGGTQSPTLGFGRLIATGHSLKALQPSLPIPKGNSPSEYELLYREDWQQRHGCENPDQYSDDEFEVEYSDTAGPESLIDAGFPRITAFKSGGALREPPLGGMVVRHSTSDGRVVVPGGDPMKQAEPPIAPAHSLNVANSRLECRATLRTFDPWQAHEYRLFHRYEEKWDNELVYNFGKNAMDTLQKAHEKDWTFPVEAITPEPGAVLSAEGKWIAAQFKLETFLGEGSGYDKVMSMINALSERVAHNRRVRYQVAARAVVVNDTIGELIYDINNDSWDILKLRDSIGIEAQAVMRSAEALETYPDPQDSVPAASQDNIEAGFRALDDHARKSGKYYAALNFKHNALLRAQYELRVCAAKHRAALMQGNEDIKQIEDLVEARAELVRYQELDPGYEGDMELARQKWRNAIAKATEEAKHMAEIREEVRRVSAEEERLRKERKLQARIHRRPEADEEVTERFHISKAKRLSMWV